MDKIVLGISEEAKTPEERFLIFKRLYNIDHDTAFNTIHTLCDFLNHLKDWKLLDCKTLLQLLVKSDFLTSVEKMFISVSLFNNGMIQDSFNCFKYILSTDTDYIAQTESIKYLYGSEEFDDILMDFIIPFIKNKKYSCEKRYKFLNELFHSEGIKLYFNIQKLTREINFSMALNTLFVFFFDKQNDIVYRLLAIKQNFLLQSTFSKTDNLDSVFKELFEICNDTTISDDDRYNAADTIYRSGTIENQQKANDILLKLQESKRLKSIYNNAYNVHTTSILESVEKFLCKLVSDIEIKVDTLESTVNSITGLIKNSNLSESEYIGAFSSLNRITIDHTIFTKYKFTLSEILCKVWKKIQLSDKKEFLESRLVQELIEIQDWNTGCSTGFASRLVNVFSGIDDTLCISWKEQIEGNIKGRIEAKIRESEISDVLVLGMLPDAEERQIYLDFVNSCINDIKQEMKQEFSLYIKDTEFENIFSQAIKLWL